MFNYHLSSTSLIEIFDSVCVKLYLTITGTQFFRCLDMNLGLRLTNPEENILKQTYDLKGNGRVCWKQFANSINSSFQANDFKADPSFQKVDAPEL